MIIRDGENAYGFVHNPRTSGTSITEYLIQHCGGRVLANLPQYLRQHSIYAEEVRYRKFPNHYLFGFIRNPFSREYSLYQLYCQARKSTIDFKSWCLSEDRTYRRPQYGYFCDRDGKLVATAFRYEDRTNAIEQISSIIKTDAYKFASFTSSKSPVFGVDMSYVKMYDNEMIESISKHYAVDLQAFGYYFDGYNEDIQEVPFQFTEDTIYYSQPPIAVGVINV